LWLSSSFRENRASSRLGGDNRRLISLIFAGRQDTLPIAITPTPVSVNQCRWQMTVRVESTAPFECDVRVSIHAAEGRWYRASGRGPHPGPEYRFGYRGTFALISASCAKLQVGNGYSWFANYAHFPLLIIDLRCSWATQNPPTLAVVGVRPPAP
jgi:hypothetical protein